MIPFLFCFAEKIRPSSTYRLAGVSISKYAMNYIQENTSEVDFYTSMNDVARWPEIDLKDYDWHISDIDGAWPELDDPSWV